VLAAAGLAAGCAQRSPVLYPNPHLLSVGMERAEADVAACMSYADAYVGGRRAADAAEQTAGGVVVGGATGAAAGAVFGRAGSGAAAGAAGGATRGLMGSLFQRGPDPMVRAFVNRCLRERGYEPIGWR